MRDNRDILGKLRWLSNDMEYMEVPGEWLSPVTEAHSTIFRQREEIEKLRAALRDIEGMIPHATPDYSHRVWTIARAALGGE